MTAIQLPSTNGLESYRLGPPTDYQAPQVSLNRVAFAAAHVVANPLSASDPWTEVAVDWDATLAYRRYLWSHGLAVAEAMDTAQRGMGLNWVQALELIQKSVSEASSVQGAVVFSGVGTDHLIPSRDFRLEKVESAYLEQLAAVQQVGSRVILMASRALALIAKDPADYAKVYEKVLQQADQPVILHWLGEMFDPALAGYWGSSKTESAMDACLQIIKANSEKIDGIKISLLSKEAEIIMRRQLPERVRMYTGDDFNYAELIVGDDQGYSDALLGIFDAIAPAAAAALAHLAVGNQHRFHEIFAPTVPLSRHIFGAPTRFYKTGIVFLAWLNGHQTHFTMVGGQESARSTLHLVELFRLADQAGLLTDPEMACSRMKTWLETRGVG